jgi:glucan phosphoethanolaminetransferase (alkaline phosphatase superfamily)
MSVLTEAKVVTSMVIMFLVMHFMLYIVNCSYFLISDHARVIPVFLRITHFVSAGIYCIRNSHRILLSLFRVTAQCASSAAVTLCRESGFMHLLQCFAVNIRFSLVMFK